MTDCKRDKPDGEKPGSAPNDAPRDSEAALSVLDAAMAAAGTVAYVWRRDDDRIEWRGSKALDDIELPAAGSILRDMVHPQDRPILALMHANREPRNHPLDSRAGDDNYRLTYRMRSRSGDYRWLEDSGRLVDRDSAAGILRFSPAHHNPTAGTGRGDKSYLCAALDSHLRQGGQAPGYYLQIGVDRLSRVNHAFGHRVGESVLRTVGHCLERVVGDIGVVGHAEGDQFGALLPSLDENAATGLTERLLREVAEIPIAVDDARLTVTISAGLVELAGIDAGQQAITAAHAALIQAKNEGRNRIAAHRPATVAHGRRDLEMMNKVHDAIAAGRLRLFYQPIVDAVTGQIRYHECLTRIVEEDGAVIEAGKFMPLVEDMGLVRTIDRMALELAVDEITRDPDARLAINVSGYTVGDTAWIDLAHGLLGARPDLAARLVVEITETRTLGSLERASAFAAALGDLGCKISLDDFGAGNTSFSQLKSMPIDILKIDRRFAYREGDGPETQLFVRALVALAESLGMETVAEGIETDAAARVAGGEGVTHMQGFLFGRPAPTRPTIDRARSRWDARGMPAMHRDLDRLAVGVRGRRGP